jgi:CHAT domain-containing protein/Tfp pilus assembly protein PilF
VSRALAIREKVLGPDHPGTAKSLNNLALLLRSKDDYDGAEPLYRRALAIMEKALGPDHPETATILNNLALLLQAKGESDSAEPFYRRALAIREKALGPDHPETAQSLDSLASLLKYKGDNDAAEPLYRRALAIREKALGPDHPDTAQSLDSLALLLKYKGDNDDAEALYRRALAIAETALGPQYRLTFEIYDNLAGLLGEKGDYDGAVLLYQRGLAFWEKVLGPDHPDTAITLRNLALMLEKKGDYDGAEPFYRRALVIWEKALGPDHPYTATSLINLAGLFLKTGVVSEALELSRRVAVSGYPNRNTYLLALDASDSPSKLLLSESFSVVQSTSSSEAGSALASLAARFSAGSSELAQLVRQEQDEASRESFLDKAFLAGVGKSSQERNPKREETLKTEIADVKDRLAAIRARLESDFPDYAELSRPKPLDLKDTQELLKDDEALVIIDTVKDGKGDYVWAVTSNDAAWQSLETAKGEIDDLVAALLPALNPDNQAEVDLAKVHRLYQLTLGSVEKQISGKKHLIFVLNGAMTSLPPHVLVTRDPAAKALRDVDWLIKNYAVTVLPTVSSLKLLRGSPAGAAASKPMRGYADIAYAPNGATGNLDVASRSVGEAFTGGVAKTSALQGASPLPATGPEAKAVMQVLGGDEGDIVTGRKASEAEVKSAPLSHYRVLYFATHGLLAGEVEELAKVKAEPALLFAIPEKPTPEDDGLLTASEVAQLKLNADWAVLSACNTAAGGKPGAAALSGLARAFFYAGTRSLLVSHWPVDDEVTKVLMVRLFENVKATPGGRAAEAHQKAMLSVINDHGNPQWANPAYWAPFILVGEPR